MDFWEEVWYCNRDNETASEEPTYNEPKKIITRPNYFSVMPAEAGGYLQLLKHGETIFETWIVCVNSKIFPNILQEGDLLWVDGEKPNQELEQLYGNGATANAVVSSVSKGRFATTITLKRNQRQVVK
jgi:hypothetical protein